MEGAAGDPWCYACLRPQHFVQRLWDSYNAILSLIHEAFVSGPMEGTLGEVSGLMVKQF